MPKKQFHSIPKHTSWLIEFMPHNIIVSAFYLIHNVIKKVIFLKKKIFNVTFQMYLLKYIIIFLFFLLFFTFTSCASV